MLTRLTKEKEMQNMDVQISPKRIHGKYGMHGHEYFEMEYILSGTGTYTINGTCFPIKAGMLFFLTPADVHSVYIENGELITVNFSEKLGSANRLVQLARAKKTAALFLKENDRRMTESLLTELLSCRDDASYSIQIVECIVSKIARHLNGGRESAHTYTVSQRAMLYMLNHFRTPLTLEKMAKELGITPAYLSSVFTKETGENIKNYIDNLRFDYAKNLLTYSEFTVQEVSAESGFVSYSNFIRRFKMRYGISPGAYKKSKQKE
ncbi:MAG: helix-turn-helix transcriptional regulator [Clostridia bacterium]|nr:helix-turn-helix transcriptional regulator [Clostridia bacterium]